MPSTHWNSNSYKDDSELTKEHIKSLRFDIEEEAEQFYNAYARKLGFGIRKDKRTICSKTGNLIMRSRVCSKEGFHEKKYVERKDRERSPKALIRVGCPAQFRIRQDGDRFFVSLFRPEHNHDLVPFHLTHHIPSHWFVDNGSMAVAQSMQSVGINTSKIMDFMVNQVGSYEKVGFTYKDLYNRMYRECVKQVVHRDAEAALAYVSAKAESDPQYFLSYSVDENERLNCLFWADSKSWVDYACFGDVLAFDSTYKSNDCHKPVVVLAGVNNHF